MKLLNLEMSNFRGVEEAQIAFDGRSAIIYGINGMGKSTILHACNLLFARILQTIAESKLGYDQDFQIMESDIKIGEDKTRIQIDISLEDTQLSAVRKAVLKILDNDFSDIKIRISDDDAQMIAVKHGTELSIAQLSEGEKCVLAMTGDLARKLAIANPKRENPLEGEGVVLIDEVDLHLHPKWQGRIMPLLLNTFPNIQFIVTTHSPKILGEITDEADVFEIYEEDGNIKVRKKPSMSGWDMNDIMQQFIHTKILNQKTEHLIDLMYEYIDNQEFEKAEKLADELAQMTNETNTNVVRARTLIHRNR